MAQLHSKESATGCVPHELIAIGHNEGDLAQEVPLSTKGLAVENRTLPTLGLSRPENILRTVVLPAPLGQRKPITSPAATSKVISVTPSTP